LSYWLVVVVDTHSHKRVSVCACVSAPWPPPCSRFLASSSFV
jgi:hypothetical protein